MQQIAAYVSLIPTTKHFMKPLIPFLLAAVCTTATIAQTVPQIKTTPATRTQTSPKIDGVLTDAVWANAPLITNFVELRPTPGKPEPNSRRTEIRILYDDVAIYVAAKMFDHPDSVMHELVPRDNIGNADFVGVIFDTFNDKINGSGFYVTAAGVQFDAKYSAGGNEDDAWNAVYETATKLNEDGWSAEFKIPYSALRFSSASTQNWGLQFIRKRSGFNQQYFWSPLDPKINGLLNQSGLLTGIKDIKAPVRLSFFPYVSSYVTHYPYNSPGIKNTKASLNGGMDVKYGINKSFTLDVTLIPDFGQVQSDNRILNLTPFEVKYDERRPFFTEGTELFSKGDLFYSRRIGNSPSYRRDINKQLATGETIVRMPTESKLLNATKLSGRTASGLGVGVFNAVTDRMYAEVENAAGQIRKVESQPLTNFNVVVLDQSLKNSSSVSFVNTNVLRQGHDRDANVTAAMFNLNDKKQVYNFQGAAKMSHITGRPDGNGFMYELNVGKQSGNFSWEYAQELADTNFDPSDIGFFTNNNYFDQGLELRYKIFKPGKWYNEMGVYTGAEYSRRFKKGAFQEMSIEYGYFVQFKNFWNIEVGGHTNTKGNDFYESRNGMVYRTPAETGYLLFVNPNRSKAYNLGGNIRYTTIPQYNGKIWNFYLFQNFRLSDHLSLGLDLNYAPSYNSVNWVGFNAAQSVFSKYDRQTVENSADAKYTFNNKMGLSAVVRHYWSDRRNKEFYALNASGGLDAYTGPALKNIDRSYNVFNIDFIYTWQFAPGSELSVAYKNAAETDQRFYTKRYFKNFDNIIGSSQNNSVSVKILYYIDFLNLQKRNK